MNAVDGDMSSVSFNLIESILYMGVHNEGIHHVWDPSEKQFVQKCAAVSKVWGMDERNNGQKHSCVRW